MSSGRRFVLLVAGALALVGIGLRAWNLGTYGFWNDEAWVALCTRVQGLRAFWLAIAPTPVLWAVTLDVWSVLGTGEGWLRGLAFVASVAGLWMAFRLGRRIAGHPAGGLLPLAILAVEPLSVAHAKLLKQYSAEAVLALLAFDATARFAAGGERRALVGLAIVLALGVGFANSQLLLGPPLLAALLATMLARRDWTRARWVAFAGVAIASWDVAWFRLVIAPRLLPSLGAYFAQEYAPAGSLSAALRAVVGTLERDLTPAFGSVLLLRALAALALVVTLWRHATLAVAALALVVEVTLLSSWHRFPIGEPRVLLFLLTVLAVLLSAAVAPAVAWSWRRAWFRPVAVVAGLAAAAVFARDHDWRDLADVHQIEDLGPLVRQVEAERRPGEPLLLYRSSIFVYAYYQRRTPLLLPNPTTTVGYAPVIDDPDVVLVDGASLPKAADAAFAKATRVRFLGSRMHVPDPSRVRLALQRPGWRLDEWARPNALLLRATRTPPT